MTMQDPGFRPTRRQRRREHLAYLRFVRLLGAPVRQPRPSRRVPVLLVPGFLAWDWSLVPLSRYLRRRGHRTFGSGLRLNAGCTEDLVESLERRLATLVAREGGPLAVVGQSRGGVLGRLLATRRPDLVAVLITVGSPTLDQLAAAPQVLKQVDWLLRLNRTGRRRLLTEDCVRGECAARVRESLRASFPAGVPYTAVYSPDDGIVDWRACLDPAAIHVEVHTSHNGMATHRSTRKVIETRLAEIDGAAG